MPRGLTVVLAVLMVGMAGCVASDIPTPSHDTATNSTPTESGTATTPRSDSPTESIAANQSPPSSPTVIWNRTYGRNGSQTAFQISNTTDAGYVLLGSTVQSNSFDGWAARINASGEEQWNRSYGTSESDSFRSGVQTLDGGFLLVGDTGSITGDSATDAWLVKINESGHKQWTKSYGGEKADGALSIVSTGDGGYLLAGNTCSFGTNCNAWVVKVDADGTELWNRTVGQGSTNAYEVIGTRDGGFLLTGVTKSGQNEFVGWVAKLNATGHKQWNQTYGVGSFVDSVQTRDGGYALAGTTSSSENASNSDIWLVKTTGSGQLEWQRTFGWREADEAQSLVQTADGGFAVAGSMIPPKLFGLTTQFGVVKTNESGREQWRWTGGTPWGMVRGIDERVLRDDAYSIVSSGDGNLLVAGQAQRPNDNEAWVVRLSPNRSTTNQSTTSTTLLSSS